MRAKACSTRARTLRWEVGPHVAIGSVHELDLRPAEWRRRGCIASGCLSKAERITIGSVPQWLASGRQVDLGLSKPQIIDELADIGIGRGAASV